MLEKEWRAQFFGKEGAAQLNIILKKIIPCVVSLQPLSAHMSLSLLPCLLSAPYEPPRKGILASHI